MADDITVEETIQVLKELLDTGRIVAHITDGQMGYRALTQGELDSWRSKMKKPPMTTGQMVHTPKRDMRPWHVVNATEAHPWSTSCCGRDGFVFPGNNAAEAIALLPLAALKN